MGIFEPIKTRLCVETNQSKLRSYLALFMLELSPLDFSDNKSSTWSGGEQYQRPCEYSIHCLSIFPFSHHTTPSAGSHELKCHNTCLPAMPSGLPRVPRKQSSFPGNLHLSSGDIRCFCCLSLFLTEVHSGDKLNDFQSLQVQNFPVLSAKMKNFYAFTWISQQYYLCPGILQNIFPSHLFRVLLSE